MAILSLAGIFLWLLAMTFSPSYQQCDGSRAAEYRQPYEPGTYETVGTFLTCQGRSLDANEDLLTALGTVTIAIFTLTLWRSTKRSGEHFQVSERAYVKLSHFPPGAYWEQPPRNKRLYGHDNRRWIRCDLRVKNFGDTPAKVREVRITHKIVPNGERLPDKPDYSGTTIEISEAFLVVNDQFTQPIRIEITSDQLAAILKKESWLYLFGYVEYADKFDATHRAGYARRYDREEDIIDPVFTTTGFALNRTELTEKVNNLVFIGQTGYNYDIAQDADGTWPQS